MYNIIYVNTREELIDAVNVSFDYIVITNKKLARNVEIVIFTSKAAFPVVIVSALVGAVVGWYYVGMSVDTLMVFLKIAFVFIAALFIVVLGITALWSSPKKWIIRGKLESQLLSALWSIGKDWKIKDKLTSTLPNGTSIEGEIILERDESKKYNSNNTSKFYGKYS